MPTPKKKQKSTFELSFEQEQLAVSGALNMDNASVFFNSALSALKNYTTSFIKVNLQEVNKIDSSGVVALFYLKSELEKREISVDIVGGSDSIKQKLELFKPSIKKVEEQPIRKGFFELIGERVFQFFLDHVGSFIQLTADILYWSVKDFFRPKNRRKGEVVDQAIQVGVNAVPIILGMTFIIGLVMALQSAAQLRNFGADIFIVDLTVIAMMSEMGPLITAILVAGRSGSAIAAEIATMKVTNELDALQTMGLNPIRFVVVPKVYGSLLTLPFLTILASVAGIIGGATAAYFYLGITPEIFFNRMADSLYNKDIITGIVKSLVFASLIVFTGSYFGFIVKRGAEGVGKVTTKSVVVSISLVIVADSIMSLLFY